MTVHLSELVTATPASDVLMGVIGVMSLVALVAVVWALFSLGRQAYRK